MSLHNWILNFKKITKLPLTASPTSRLPAPCLWPGRTPARPPVPATWPRPSSKPLPRPWFAWHHSLLATPELATRPASATARHDAMAGRPLPRPCPSPDRLSSHSFASQRSFSLSLLYSAHQRAEPRPPLHPEPPASHHCRRPSRACRGDPS